MFNIDNFVDDIIIFTSTWEQRLQVLEQLFMRLRDAILTVKPIKCFTEFHDLECLGHMVGGTIINLAQKRCLPLNGLVAPLQRIK